MMPSEFLDAASVLITLAFFSLGSYFDLKSREVSDRVWLAYAPLGIAVTVGHLIVGGSALFLVAVSIGLTIVVSFGLFYLGLFGGADAKAILCLGLAIPIAPTTYRPLIGYAYPFFPIVVTITSYLCSTSVVLWIGLRNMVHYLHRGEQMFEGFHEELRWRKALACLTGFPVEQARLRSTFYLYPMEKVVQSDSGVRRAFRLFVSAEEDREQEISRLQNQLQQIGYDGEVWVTPGLPQLLFLLAALIITLIAGDPIFGMAVKLATHS
jgi:preflagellin peptidase FlaK